MNLEGGSINDPKGIEKVSGPTFRVYIRFWNELLLFYAFYKDEVFIWSQQFFIKCINDSCKNIA